MRILNEFEINENNILNLNNKTLAHTVRYVKPVWQCFNFDSKFAKCDASEAKLDSRWQWLSPAVVSDADALDNTSFCFQAIKRRWSLSQLRLEKLHDG